MKVRVIVAALALAVCADARAQSNDELKQLLEQAQRTIQDLQNRVKALEQRAATPSPPVAAPVAPSPAPTPQQAAQPAPTAGAVVVAPGLKPEAGLPEPAKARLEIFGFVQADAIQDFQRMDPSWKDTLRPTKIPVNCPADPGCGKMGETSFSVKQTRFDVLGYLPTSYGELKTKFEFDLFGVGADAGQTTIRLRHAYGELGSFLAGQTNSLFMDGDVFPNVIDYWGPNGMVFFRNVQFRWTPLKENGVQAAMALEGPGVAVDDSSQGFGNGTGAHNKVPDLTGMYRMDQPWGHWQVSGILRKLGYDTPSGSSGNPAGTATGWGINLAGAYNTFGNDKLMGQIVYGHGIANYMNDAGPDLATDSAGNGEAVPLLGWLVYYDHYWTDQLSSSVGVSQVWQSNTDGQTASAFHKGDYASVNLLFQPIKNWMYGGELLWGKRENNNGAAGNDTRLQFSVKYSY